MRILIAADMEGITGVVNWDQVDPAHPEYPRFRRLMTGDVNAAIRGALAAGADEVVVSDGHAMSNNILIEELEHEARLNTGGPSPFSMVQGVDQGVDGVLLVGYHARAGTPNAILDHTWSSSTVYNLWLNDILVGEFGLNSAVCGHFNVPVLMVSGDQSVCAEARALLGDIRTIIVKQASGRMAAECLPPHHTQVAICEAAAEAVRGLAEGRAPAPLRLENPVQVRVEWLSSEMADKAALFPGSRRSGRCVEASAADMPAAYSLFRTLVALAR
jgi:D-amino peptidase